MLVFLTETIDHDIKEQGKLPMSFLRIQTLQIDRNNSKQVVTW